MHVRIRNIWYQIRSSLWFLPALLTLSAIILSFVTSSVDRFLETHAAAGSWWSYSGGPDGARAVLSTIAGSMITMASVVFSITIVVLTLASSQFGPRLIRNFMNQRANQLVLGLFVATFTYGVLVLRIVDANADTDHIPGFSVITAIVIAIVSLGVLIYFIHHVSESIQAQHIIARVCNDLDKTVDRIFPEKLSRENADEQNLNQREYSVSASCGPESCPVKTSSSGYLQAVDREALQDLAVERNLLIHLDYRPGNFITQGNALVTVWPGTEVDDGLTRKINELFILGPERTLEQDVEYAISQLTEIAVRALSSGINDPITANTCIDWLGAALSKIARRKLPGSHSFDSENRLRMICKPFTFAGMLDAAFNMIRQNSETNAAVSIHLLETITTIAGQAVRKDDRRALLKHARMVTHGCRQTLSAENDRQDLELRYKAAVAAIQNNQQTSELQNGSVERKRSENVDAADGR